MFTGSVEHFLLLALGLVGLWLGTEMVVGNAVILARRMAVSELFIGLTVLALGTDLPELLVALDGALHTAAGIQSSGVVAGTAVGSSISQIGLVLGLTGLFRYVTIGSVQLRLLGLELLASCLLLFLLALDGVITRVEGAVLLVVFVAYVGHAVANRSVASEPEEGDAPKDRATWQAVLYLVGGLAVVVLGSELTVDEALAVSADWGLQQSFVGAVLVGLGTSIPELAVSLRAISAGRAGLSVGNVVGSNIFDLLVPTGAAAAIVSLEVDDRILWYDLPVLFLTTGIVLTLLARKRGLQRWEGSALVVLYLGYVLGRYLLEPGPGLPGG